MTSSDNQQYITVELFNARMEKLEAIIERNLAITRADIAELKTFVEKIMLNLKPRLPMSAPKSESNLPESITSFTGIIGSSLSLSLSS